MSSPRAGAILGGRYRLVRPLAAGGMGAVWIAHHIDLEVDVAVKLIEGEGTRRPELLERFRREARAAAQLKTPHVVQILDFGVDGETPYIAMELLQGSDLDAHLAEQGTLSPARACAILRPLCKALEVAHGAGIVHRDLKPANVFLATIGGDEVVKIVDFGIAKELNRGAEWTTGTAMVGSPLFMSPEQIRGSGHVDARTDVWALGVIAYLMLFGEPPFHGDGLPAIFYNIAHGPFEAPSTRSPALAPLDAFFARALARDVTQRHQTVGELLAGFEQAVRQLPDPSLAVRPSGRVSRDGTLASPGIAPATPAHPAPGSNVGARPASTPAVAEVAPGGDGTVSAFDSSPRPMAPPGPLARAKSTTSSGKPGSAMPLVVGGVAVVLGVIAFIVVQAGGAHRSAEAPTASDARAAADAAPAGVPAVQPATGSSPNPAPSAAPDAGGEAPVATASAAAAPASEPPPAPRADGTASASRSKAAPAKPPPPPASSPASKAPAAPARQTTVDPEWGVPVQR